MKLAEILPIWKIYEKNLTSGLYMKWADRNPVTAEHFKQLFVDLETKFSGAFMYKLTNFGVPRIVSERNL